MGFPDDLEDVSVANDIEDGTTIMQATQIDVLNVLIDALQAKMGINGSADTASHDFKINRKGVQTVKTETQTMSTGATSVPIDDTKPQNTEGTEWFTRAITPVDAANLLEIKVQFWWASNADAGLIGSIFQDSIADALESGIGNNSASLNAMRPFEITHWMVAGTTSSTTFKFRAGGTSGTITMNGINGSRVLGGAITSRIEITEWKV